MAEDQHGAQRCPQCRGTDIEPGSVTYSDDPRKRHRPDAPALPDPIGKKYRCRTCDAEFHVVERPNG